MYSLVPHFVGVETVKTMYRKAIALPALRERDEVGHVLINLEGYFYVETPFIPDFGRDGWTVDIMVERDDEPLPNEDERKHQPKVHPHGWPHIELFRGVARDSEEALDHDSYVDDEDEGPVCWNSGTHTHHLLLTYHYEDTPLSDGDRRSIAHHPDYEFRPVPSPEGTVIIHIESWFKTEE